MTPEQIIELAKKAGFHFRDAGYGPEILHTNPLEYSQRCFERFAQLVRNAALEEAADSLYGNGLEMSLLQDLREEIRSLKS